ncbi:hypothetical protein XENTR_v10004280 [Xenopus tropicalis]|uniref:Uncharacterized LOC100485064 n=1 Tax=Xenopus tropicalis TaxID=8364 RepID=A0A6I8SJZ1_XENTR|nr:uncharacterized protein LOC100485064 isoform X2 [Xenopus tropicalis]KAE8576671.1 hypothetical protein XENTR_v10004280 [Xenopus tropicalis]KAE8576672.1 hypothetical protein XENTR_v10004280 [Xenopus tropicalis]KAE8576673.1 hypothetical protein XENTR_v10004280 [Xenopus tropicalis]KAE8576674.1 hypothetical protein XENTR_v10004280 [Xenopus tropicalis]KAE8576675.1 hypothetical protein XENTR_v10004280 [Xenopus tropicalis]|eukprot:XP_012808311.1 PREDICTED: uncharacterized protein LOC100485064 isoform X2 [Xenopus tropicalis]
MLNMDKMKPDKQKNEMIVNHALDIIYMLTGEEYIIEKKNSHPNYNNSRAGEVPVKYDDIAVYFSKDEWEYLEKHKEIYQEQMISDEMKCDDFDIFSAGNSDHSQTDMSSGLPRLTLLTPQSRANGNKKTRLQFQSSIQLTQLMHSIARLGRRVAKIDRNISHILKEFNTNKTASAKQSHGSSPLKEGEVNAPRPIKTEQIQFDVHQDQVYQAEQNPSPRSSCEPHSQSFSGLIGQIKQSSCSHTGPLPANSQMFANHLEISEHLQIHYDSTSNVDSTREISQSPPPPLSTSTGSLVNAISSDVPTEKPPVLTNLLKTPQCQEMDQTKIHTSDTIEKTEPDIHISETRKSRKTSLPKTSSINIPTVTCPAFIIVSEVSEQNQANYESLRTPDTVGDPLPDIPLASMTTGILNNFKMQSRGQPHRFAQLLFQHHVPYSLYKTWTHNTNFDGSRGKHALPKNLKRVILNETSAAYKMTPVVLKKIKDTLNALLRIPRTGGWDSNSDHG